MIVFSKKIYKPISCKIAENSKFLQIQGILGIIHIAIPKKKIIKNEHFFSVELKKKGHFSSLKNQIFQAFIGVSAGWFLRMELVGRGFSVNFFKNFLIFNVGYSHTICVIFSKNIQCMIDANKKSKFLLFGSNLQELYNLAAEIKKIKPVNIYKGSGIKFENEKIKLKPGKQGSN